MYLKYIELRDAAGISDYKVAKETGLSTAQLSCWKKNYETNGKEGYNPKVDKLQKIAKYFNVPIEYFLENENEKREKHS